MKTKKLIVMLAVCAFSATGVYAQRVEIDLVDGHPVINCDQMPAAAITSTSKGSTEAEWKTAAANEAVFHRFAVYKDEERGKTMDLSNAITKCSTLGAGWRLPTQRELMLLMCVLKDELEKTAGFTQFYTEVYWSATEDSRDPNYNWAIISDGFIKVFLKTSKYLAARCIKEL